MTADLLSLYHTALPSASYVPAIIALTLTVRLTALPLVYLGLREQSKLTRVIPDIQFIHSLYKKKLSELPINATADRITATQKFVKGTRAVMAYKGFSPLLMFVSPLAQIPIFLYVSSEMREIATYGKMQLMQYELTPDAPLDASVDPTLAQMSADFTTSGLLWFTDLTVPDPQYVLPVAVCGLMYTSLEVGFGGGSQDSVKKATIFTMLKSGLQQGAILGLPFVAAFPASVQLYITSSVCFSLVQMPLLRTDMARNIMGLPSLSATPPPPVLMKEHIEELKRKAKEDAEKDRGKALWDAKTVLVGYKPGSGVLQPGESVVKTGRLVKSSIEMERIEAVPDDVMERANKGEVGGKVWKQKDVIMVSEDLLSSQKPKKKKKKKKGGKKK